MKPISEIKEYDRIRNLKRKKYCKFTKGEHKFFLIKEHTFKFWKKGTYREYKCELCGKKKFEW